MIHNDDNNERARRLVDINNDNEQVQAAFQELEKRVGELLMAAVDDKKQVKEISDGVIARSMVTISKTIMAVETALNGTLNEMTVSGITGPYVLSLHIRKDTDGHTST